MEAGQKLDEGALKIAAVYPDRDVNSKDRNGHSLVLSVNYEEYSMLLTGDVGTAGEKRILEKGMLGKGMLEREILEREILEREILEREILEKGMLEKGMLEKGMLGKGMLEKEMFGKGLSVLKAGHHGSSTSTGQEFLAFVKPSVTILSYGRGNSYGHPSPEVVKRLKETGTRIWSTEQSGAIHITTNGKKMKVSGFLLDRNRGSGL